MSAYYRFSFDPGQCLNCGVCVDVCPVRCLDMTRPAGHGPEGDFDRGDWSGEANAWMTVFPVQTGRCTGCMVCRMECPTDIVHIDKVEEPVAFAPVPGPVVPEPDGDEHHWQPLSAYTRMSHTTRPKGDPWGPEYKWKPVWRLGNWRVWRTWRTDKDYERAAADADKQMDEKEA